MEFLNITAWKKEAPAQPWHCVLAGVSDSHALPGMLQVLRFRKAIPAGTKSGFEFNYILFEMERS